MIMVTHVPLGLLVLALSAAIAKAGGESDFTVFEDDESTIELEDEGFGWAFNTRIDAEGSVLWADGIILDEYSIGTRLTSEPIDLALTITRNSYDVDYEPSIFGAPTSLAEDSWTYAFDSRVSLAKNWNLLGSASYYDGYTDYRSLWINEYYSQLFGEVPGYIEAAPKGSRFNLGVEWEYIPVVAKIRLTGVYGKDTIAPASEFGENGLERSRPDLYTKSLQLQTENVLSQRVIVQNTFQFTDTTNREKRWSGQTAWNIALAEDWFLRLNAGGAIEQPNFDAYYFGGAVEYRFADDWFFRLNGRYYEDTGEIENSLGGFTSSAPSLKSVELGAGIRWQGVHNSVNLYVGYYQTEYAPLAEDNIFLENLYNDRRWGLVQLTYTHTF
jgi:hypothetical protein